MTSSRIFTSNDVNILVAGIKNSHFSLSNVHKPIMIYAFDLMVEPRSSQNKVKFEIHTLKHVQIVTLNIGKNHVLNTIYSTPNNHSN